MADGDGAGVGEGFVDRDDFVHEVVGKIRQSVPIFILDLDVREIDHTVVVDVFDLSDVQDAVHRRECPLRGFIIDFGLPLVVREVFRFQPEIVLLWKVVGPRSVEIRFVQVVDHVLKPRIRGKMPTVLRVELVLIIQVHQGDFPVEREVGHYGIGRR